VRFLHESTWRDMLPVAAQTASKPKRGFKACLLCEKVFDESDHGRTIGSNHVDQFMVDWACVCDQHVDKIAGYTKNYKLMVCRGCWNGPRSEEHKNIVIQLHQARTKAPPPWAPNVHVMAPTFSLRAVQQQQPPLLLEPSRAAAHSCASAFSPAMWNPARTAPLAVASFGRLPKLAQLPQPPPWRWAPLNNHDASRPLSTAQGAGQLEYRTLGAATNPAGAAAADGGGDCGSNSPERLRAQLAHAIAMADDDEIMRQIVIIIQGCLHGSSGAGVLVDRLIASFDPSPPTDGEMVTLCRLQRWGTSAAGESGSMIALHSVASVWLAALFVRTKRCDAASPLLALSDSSAVQAAAREEAAKKPPAMHAAAIALKESVMSASSDSLAAHAAAASPKALTKKRPRPHAAAIDSMLWEGAEAAGWRRHATKHSAWVDPQGKYFESASHARRIMLAAPDEVEAIAERQRAAKAESNARFRERKRHGEVRRHRHIVMPDGRQMGKPDERQVAMSDERQVAMPDERQMVMPDERQVAMPDERQVAMPDERQVAMPDERQVVMPDEARVDKAHVTRRVRFNLCDDTSTARPGGDYPPLLS